MFILISILAALFLLSVPALAERKFDPLHPFILMSVSFAIGGVGKSIYLLSSRSGSVMPSGVTLWGLKVAAIVVLIGSLFTVVGYHMAGINRSAVRVYWPKVKGVNATILNLICTTYIIIGIFCLSTLYSVNDLVELMFSLVSQKRDIRSGYLVWGIDLLFVGGLIQVFMYLKGGKLKNIILSVTSLSIYMSYGFVTSRRGLIIGVIVALGTLYHYYCRRLSFKNILLGSTLFFAIFFFMGRLRSPTRLGEYEIVKASKEYFLDKFIRGDYLFDLPTIARIIQDVPKKLDYQYGETLITWTLMPIPRSIWQDKPVNIGQIIGAEIYNKGFGIVGGGVPPPFWSELYLNFNIVGVVIGSVVFGFVVGTVYKSVKEGRWDQLGVILYSLFLFKIVGIFNGGLSKPLTGFIKLSLPIFLALLVSSQFTGKKKRTF